MVVAIYIIGVGLRRCSFRLAGPFSGASYREASASAGLHVFFVSWLIPYYNIYIMVAVALDHKNMNMGYAYQVF